MEFIAEIKAVKLASSKTVIMLEVSPDQTGSLDGLQLLMSQTVSIDVSPLQTSLNLEDM